MSLRSLGLVLLTLGVTAHAPAGQLRVAADPTRDVLHTLQARRLLVDDPELAALNLGVRVRNRVATLWGPVPSAELSFKAEIRLRALVELVEVRNELFVTGESVPTPDGPLQTPPLPLFLPEQLPPALPPPGLRTVNRPPPSAMPAELELPPLTLPSRR